MQVGVDVFLYVCVFVQEGEGETCILLWAKSLSVGIFRRGRWEDHDLTPDTFGKDVTAKLQGSSCNKAKSKYLLHTLRLLRSGLGPQVFMICSSLFIRLVLNYNNVLGHSNFKLM